jgi:hypothetical protein
VFNKRDLWEPSIKATFLIVKVMSRFSKIEEYLCQFKWLIILSSNVTGFQNVCYATAYARKDSEGQ